MTQQASVPASKGWGLSASTLKILACVFMLTDHAGMILFPDVELLRIIGRLAYPFFAYFIAEGCRYTRNKLKRFLLVLGLGVLCEGVYFFMMGEPEGGILMNFCFAILLIYQVQACKKALARGKWGMAVLWLLLFMASAAGIYAFVEQVLYVDYGFWGVLIPVFTALPDYKAGETPACFRAVSSLPVKLICCAMGMLLLCLSRGLTTNIQTYCLLALIPLALYNGAPGVKRLKYGFYLFYPLHLVVIFLVEMLLR